MTEHRTQHSKARIQIHLKMVYNGVTDDDLVLIMSLTISKRSKNSI